MKAGMRAPSHLACPRHTPATARIQRRLEQLELVHLRALVAEQGQELEELRPRLEAAERCADFWHDSVHELQEQIEQHGDGSCRLGITRQGELLLVSEGARQ
jgi:hypothetical protein